MTKLSRHLMRATKELDEGWNWKDHISDKWDAFTSWITPDVYYDVKNYLRNILLFNKLAWEWKPWDSSFSITVFKKLIVENGKACGDGHLKNGNKKYKKSLIMAAKLEKAYNYNVTEDKAYMYIATKYPMSIENGRLYRGYESCSVPDKMWHVAVNRIDKTEAKLKQEAWQYVSKHIEELWD